MTNKDIFKGVEYDSLEKQVGGKHYKNMNKKAGKTGALVDKALFSIHTWTLCGTQLQKFTTPRQNKQE